MQSHLKKIFDNLNRINIKEEDHRQIIQGMYSSDPVQMPEYVQFEKIQILQHEEKVTIINFQFNNYFYLNINQLFYLMLYRFKVG
jgi:hypothetical protein